ncbi:peptide chain release factor N(5)-glutamine methyltransferase [Streptococcus macacae]|uniref:Release factor glutamine methyltransferase n=1 Tax=Streptococcus macacae NCTC 11558 TaxID=764298 RepID=G5JUD5_9STRE|nr:peptide chain release factor N(5)-glutamine methyltransferase [Streptococcus macacae]EHJ51660.1 protein-(glutamine-N5) methyltransferase, release factor-specific [Streptococcus macacae NCTC 11558]SUN78498.1 putative protoporphyrinogen oxidase [Streptococcus macacae NCTC 11558]
MNYAQAISRYEDQLSSIGEEKESLSYIFREIKGWDYTKFILHQAKEIKAADLELMEEIMLQLKQHIPAQYITGQVHFSDLVLLVNQHVLIPRPETQELVQLILAENDAASSKVLDIGTGSGAIALSLAKERASWDITASDISEKALEVARENAQINHLTVAFLHSDVFSHISEKFDILVSNPPYIALEDKKEVEKNVLLHEPHLALFADQDGLAVYQNIAENAAQHLSSKGKIYLEIGYKQGQKVVRLFEDYFPEKRVRLLQDIFGKDRMVVVDDG